MPQWKYPGGYHSCPSERWDQQYAHAVADTLYASCGDLSLAYQVFGDGPVDLVFVGWFASHVELAWTCPNSRLSSIGSPRYVACSCLIRPGSATT